MTLHEERLALAKEITEHLLADYGDSIVAVGLHGSMAHQESDERSDLDFAILTRGGDDLRGRDIFYGGVELSLSTHGVDDYLREAGEVDDGWAIESDQYVSVLVLHDPDGVFDRARAAQERAAERAEPDDFLDRTRENVVGAAECLRKAERCVDQGSPIAANVMLTYAVVSLAQAIGLLTRTRWRGEHTAVFASVDTGARVDGFVDAYRVAAQPSGDVPARIAAAHVACRALEKHLAGQGVTSNVDALDRLLD